MHDHFVSLLLNYVHDLASVLAVTCAHLSQDVDVLINFHFVVPWARDVDGLVAILVVIGLAWADSELTKPSESCCDDVKETRVKVLDSASIVDLLNAKVELTHELLLLNDNACLHQAVDGKQDNKVSVNKLLEQELQVAQHIELLVGLINHVAQLSFFVSLKDFVLEAVGNDGVYLLFFILILVTHELIAEDWSNLLVVIIDCRSFDKFTGWLGLG